MDTTLTKHFRELFHWTTELRLEMGCSPTGDVADVAGNRYFWQSTEIARLFTLWQNLPFFYSFSNFLILGSASCWDAWGKYFDEIALSHTVKEIQAIWCICRNLKIQNGCYFSKEENFLKLGHSILLRYLVACGSKIFDEIALSHTVKEIQAILCFCIDSFNQNG